MVTTHFKEYSTNKNDTKKVLKGLVSLVGDKIALGKEVVRLRDDHEKKKVDPTMMKADAIKMIADALR